MRIALVWFQPLLIIEMSNQLTQRCNRIDHHPFYHGGFHRVVHGHEDCSDPFPGGQHYHRQNPIPMPYAAIRGKLTKKESISCLCTWLDLPGREKDAHSH